MTTLTLKTKKKMIDEWRVRLILKNVERVQPGVALGHRNQVIPQEKDLIAYAIFFYLSRTLFISIIRDLCR